MTRAGGDAGAGANGRGGALVGVDLLLDGVAYLRLELLAVLHVLAVDLLRELEALVRDQRLLELLDVGPPPAQPPLVEDGIEKLTDDAVAGVEAVTASDTEFVAPVVLVGLFLCVCCSALLFLVCVWRCVNRRGARARTRPTQVVLPPLPERGPPPPFADVMYAGK